MFHEVWKICDVLQHMVGIDARRNEAGAWAEFMGQYATDVFTKVRNAITDYVMLIQAKYNYSSLMWMDAQNVMF